jgi:hypothetical protein
MVQTIVTMGKRAARTTSRPKCPRIEFRPRPGNPHAHRTRLCGQRRKTMAIRFELVTEQDRVYFQLQKPTGPLLLKSLGSKSKIMTQNEIAHLRATLQEPSHLVPHEAADGTRFLVVKDKDGSVLAKSPHVPDASSMAALRQEILQAANTASIVDLTKRHAQHHS